MTLSELNLLIEAVRRDIYGQLNRKEVLKNDNRPITLKLSGHLNDDRENGEARGDHAMPKEILSVVRVGLKRLLKRYELEELISKNIYSDDVISFSFPLKKRKIVYVDGKKQRNKLYSLLVGVLYESGGGLYFKIITLYKPQKSKSFNKKTKFYEEL